MPIILPQRRTVSTTGNAKTLLPYPGSAGPLVSPHLRAVSSDPDQLSPSYDLVADLTENLRAYTDRDHWFALYNLPRYVSWILDRVLADHELPIGPAFVACMSYGLDTLTKNPTYLSWCDLRRAALTAAYTDASDFAYVHGCLAAIRLTMTDGATGFSRRKFRCPEGVVDQLNEAAGNLGVSGRNLAVVAVMDAVRLQDKCDIAEHRQLMDTQVEELYSRLAKQHDRLAAVLSNIGGGQGSQAPIPAPVVG